jgi:hypothetical protein
MPDVHEGHPEIGIKRRNECTYCCFILLYKFNVAVSSREKRKIKPTKKYIMCNPVLLKSTSTSHLSQCIECKTIFLWHNNFVINYTLPEFNAFREILNRTSFESNSLPFPDEIERVIVRTPHESINLTFNEQEWHNLKEVLDEGQFVLQIYDMMK